MIRDTYASLILEQIIRDLLSEGTVPTFSRIESEFDLYTNANDISKPLFLSKNAKAISGISSSASLFNQSNKLILQDLKVLYSHLLKITDVSVSTFDRWKTECDLLESRIKNLQERIQNLLFLAEDSDGYFSYIQDNFSDLLKVDVDNSTANIFLDKGFVTLGTSDTSPTRIDISNLSEKDISFTVLTRTNLVSVASVHQSKLIHAIQDVNTFWQQHVLMSKLVPVTAEIKIDLLEEKTISRIDIDFHMSNSSGNVQVTPMLSLDNLNYSPLPITNLTRSVKDKTLYQFTPQSARYVKLLLTKQGPDQVSNNLYTYEFGLDSISFFNEGFSTTTSSTLISKPLSVIGTDGEIESFSRLSLEVCEDVPENTSINFSVAVTNNYDADINDLTFVDIDPRNRSLISKPIVLDFGDLPNTTVSGIYISYDSYAPGSGFVNPSRAVVVVSGIDSSSLPLTQSGLSSDTRYAFANNNDRILSHSIDSSLTLPSNGIELWRNISIKGSQEEVRGRSLGWGFEEPYYLTTVYVSNPNGTTIDFGGDMVFFDETGYSGKVTITQGIHSVKVHKDNWKDIDISAVTDLASLKSSDSLYPYNHRYLVEGFQYPGGWSSLEEKIYNGFDIVAEYLLKEVSVFNLINTIASNDYSKFAKDKDTRDASMLVGSNFLNKTENTVFLVKIDDSNPDFINEQFLLKIKTINTLYKYIRFKATFNTIDSSIAPFLSSYRIKISP